MTTFITLFIAEWLIYFVISGMLLIVLLLWDFRTVLRVVVVVLVADIVAYTLKYIFNTPRPAEALTYFIYDPAFPSGHTAVLAALGAFLFFKNRILGLVILGLALLVGLGRVAAGIHFPIDILGGLVVGVLIGTLFSKWLKV